MNRVDALVVLAVLALTGCLGEDDPAGPDPYQPADRVDAPTTQLAVYASCAALETDLENLAIQRAGQAQSVLESGIYNPPQDGGKPTFELTGSARSATVANHPRRLQVVASGQVFVARLDHLSVHSLADATPTWTTPIEGTPIALFADDERLLVVSELQVEDLPAAHPLTALLGVQREEDYHFRGDTVSKLTVLDISDPGQPVSLRETFVEGELLGSAMSGSRVQLVSFERHESPDDLGIYRGFDEGDPEGSFQRVVDDIQAMTIADFLPRTIDRTPDGTYAERTIDEAACQAISRASDSHGDGQISLLSLDLADPGLALVERELVATAPRVVFSAERLALVVASHAGYWRYFFSDAPDAHDVFLFATDGAAPSHVATTRLEGAPQIVDLVDDRLRLYADDDLFALRPAGDQLVESARAGDLLGHGELDEVVGGRALLTFGDLLTVLELESGNASKLEVGGDILQVLPLGERALVFFHTSVGEDQVAHVALVTLDGATLVADLELGGVVPGVLDQASVEVSADGTRVAVPVHAVVGSVPGDDGPRLLRADVFRFIEVGDDSLTLLGEVDHLGFDESPEQPTSVLRALFVDERALVIGQRGVSLHGLPDLGDLAAAPFIEPTDSLPPWWP